MSYLLGIDVGSTNLKAVLFGTDGRVVAKQDVATECCHPDPAHPEWAVWQPAQIWEGIAQSVRAVTSAVAGGEILGVAVTGMGMVGVPIDKAGKWLYPFISWHCHGGLSISGLTNSSPAAAIKSGPSIPRFGCGGCKNMSRKFSAKPTSGF